MLTWKQEIRSQIEFAPPATPHNPNVPLAWTGVPGTLCQACASRLIGRGFGFSLKPLSPLYADNMPEQMQACANCGTTNYTTP